MNEIDLGWIPEADQPAYIALTDAVMTARRLIASLTYLERPDLATNALVIHNDLMGSISDYLLVLVNDAVDRQNAQQAQG